MEYSCNKLISFWGKRAQNTSIWKPSLDCRCPQENALSCAWSMSWLTLSGGWVRIGLSHWRPHLCVQVTPCLQCTILPWLQHPSSRVSARVFRTPSVLLPARGGRDAVQPGGRRSGRGMCCLRGAAPPPSTPASCWRHALLLAPPGNLQLLSRWVLPRGHVSASLGSPSCRLNCTTWDSCQP